MLEENSLTWKYDVRLLLLLPQSYILFHFIFLFFLFFLFFPLQVLSCAFLSL